MREIGIGIVGYGTVGRAAASILRANAALIKRRTGISVSLQCICSRGLSAGAEPDVRSVHDWGELVNDPKVEIIVETVGGTEVARSIVVAALAAGKPVVTANKALIAAFGDELFALARANNVPLRFEAAVAGGIPVIRALSQGAVGDDLSGVYGILNGTANYILTQMENAGLDFAAALRGAQECGYAESDPSLDIDGIDTRDKMTILTRLAFGSCVLPRDIRTMGIRHVRSVDMHYARRLDSTIRLVGAAERHASDLDISVAPWLVQRDSMLAKVQGAHNAVFLHGARLGRQVFYGEGAGGPPTGVAVVSDVVETAREICRGQLSHNTVDGFVREAGLFVPAQPHAMRWYLRLTVADKPGILARVAELIAKECINVDSVIQEPHMSKDDLSFVITVEPITEPQIARAVADINLCDFMREPVLMMRIADGLHATSDVVRSQGNRA